MNRDTLLRSTAVAIILATAALTPRSSADPAIPTSGAHDVSTGDIGALHPLSGNLDQPTSAAPEQQQQNVARPSASLSSLGAQAIGRLVRHGVRKSGSSVVRVLLRGTASWYCKPGRSACTIGHVASCRCAAASSALQRVLGPRWGTVSLRVSAGSQSVLVRLIDQCGCPNGRVLDLYAGVFDDLAPLSRGVISVSVSK